MLSINECCDGNINQGKWIASLSAYFQQGVKEVLCDVEHRTETRTVREHTLQTCVVSLD